MAEKGPLLGMLPVTKQTLGSCFFIIPQPAAIVHHRALEIFSALPKENCSENVKRVLHFYYSCGILYSRTNILEIAAGREPALRQEAAAALGGRNYAKKNGYDGSDLRVSANRDS